MPPLWREAWGVKTLPQVGNYEWHGFPTFCNHYASDPLALVFGQSGARAGL